MIIKSKRRQEREKRELKRLVKENEFFYRRTTHSAHKEKTKENKGRYCGCYNLNNSGDECYLTFGDFYPGEVALFENSADPEFEGYKDPLFLAIKHQKYEIKIPHEEGYYIIGLIDPKDVIKVETEKVLRQVWPEFFTFSKEIQGRLKPFIGIRK